MNCEITRLPLLAICVQIAGERPSPQILKIVSSNDNPLQSDDNLLPDF